MTAKTLTAWIDGNLKPVRAGVYERRLPFATRYSLWNGKHWCGFAQSIRAAVKNKHSKSIYQVCAWRGLASDPASAGDVKGD